MYCRVCSPPVHTVEGECACVRQQREGEEV